MNGWTFRILLPLDDDMPSLLMLVLTGANPYAHRHSSDVFEAKLRLQLEPMAARGALIEVYMGPALMACFEGCRFQLIITSNAARAYF